MPDFNMLFQAPNAGAAFANAFQQAQDRKQQNALMQRQMQQQDEDRALKMQQMQQSQAAAQVQQHRDSILLGGQIIRQIQPKDDASWQQAKALYIQAGGDPTEVPDHFDPQYVQNISKLADALDPQKTQRTALQQNYEFLKGQDPALANSYLHNQAEGPPMIASNGDGTFTIIPRNMVGGGSVPPPPPGFQLDGGPTPPASGAFPQ